MRLLALDRLEDRGVKSIVVLNIAMISSRETQRFDWLELESRKVC